jgi:hypothetical protein
LSFFCQSRNAAETALSSVGGSEYCIVVMKNSGFSDIVLAGRTVRIHTRHAA